MFWDGILKRLNKDDFKSVFKTKKPNNQKFILLLKKFNSKETGDVKWNGENLTTKEIEENYEHIQDFDINSINGGYFCSTCDPFLILICKLFNVNINHRYCGHMIKYEITNPIKTLNFKSNSGHFSA